MTTEMTYTHDSGGAWSALAALGDEEADVAESLRRRGIKGRVYSERHCPIANYLATTFGGKSAPFLTVASVKFFGWDKREWMATPVAVSDFIEAFDCGRYPDLVQGWEDSDA